VLERTWWTPVSRPVRTVSDATFVDVVLGSATTCVVEFHGSVDATDQEDRLSAFALANPWLACARLDVLTSPRTARSYPTATLPTYLVFRHGAVVSSATSAAELAVFLESDVGRSLIDPGAASSRSPLLSWPFEDGLRRTEEHP
jgi:hypothetical protein